MGRGQWGGGDWDGEIEENEMGRRRGRWRRAGKGQEWEGKGEAGGWTRRSGVGRGDRIGTIGRRLGGGNGEGKMERGQREWGEEGERGGGILQMDMIQAHGMPGWNEVTVFSDKWSLCLPVQRRVPQLVYTNKTGDCLFVCLFVGLFVYLFAYGRPNRKA